MDVFLVACTEFLLHSALRRSSVTSGMLILTTSSVWGTNCTEPAFIRWPSGGFLAQVGGWAPLGRSQIVAVPKLRAVLSWRDAVCVSDWLLRSLILGESLSLWENLVSLFRRTDPGEMYVWCKYSSAHLRSWAAAWNFRCVPHIPGAWEEVTLKPSQITKKTWKFCTISN